MDDLLRKDEQKEKIVIPVSDHEPGTVYKIPDDVWEDRCRLCIHKNAQENIPVPLWAVHKPQYEEIIPCRIMSICRSNDRPGECMSFAPQMKVYGICETCRYNNIFEDDFCMKKDHAEQRRVFFGTHYGGDERKIDYYSRHRLSVCDDYEPDQYVKERKQRKHEQTEDAGQTGPDV